MTREEAARLVAGLTYKDGYKFQLEVPADRDLFVIHMHARLPDSRSLATIVQEDPGAVRTSRPGLKVSSWTAVSFEAPPAALLAAVRTMVLDFERHEADEWLRLDGALLNDPHKDDPPPELPA